METSGGYSPKDLHFQDEARSKLINGITKMAKAVKSTLGPMGKHGADRITAAYPWDNCN